MGRYRVAVALAAVYVIWGSTYLAIRYAIGTGTGGHGFPPLLMAGTRFLLAGALMYAFAIRRPVHDGAPDPVGRRQWLAAGIVGVALLLGGNGLVVLAERRVDSGVAAVLVAMVPIWAALLGLVLGGERLPRLGVAGLAVGFAGAAVLGNPTGSGHLDPAGVGMLMCASLFWSCGSYYSRSAPVPRRPLVMTAMEMLCGGAALLVVGLLRGEAAGLDLGAAGWQAWTAWVYLVVAGSMLAFTAYVWLLRNARFSLATTYAYVNPAVAVVLGGLFLHERLTARALLASGLVVAGVGMIVTTRRTPAIVAAPPAPVPVEVGAD